MRYADALSVGGTMDSRLALIRERIRAVPDFPKPGILFRDITPLLAHAVAFRATVDLLLEIYNGERLDLIVAIESRGFLFGAPLALARSVPLAVVRKPGKLPWQTDEVSYELEYGKGTLQLHRDAVSAGQRVVIVDDLLATGGTAEAAARLVRKQGGTVIGCAFVIELEALQGRKKVSVPCKALLQF
jgi:adenine phosphoribosyltransferase